MGRERMADTENVEVLHAAVAAFRQREIGYRDILEDLPAAIYTTDTDGLITYFNKACIALAGRTPELGEDKWCVAWKLHTNSREALPHSKCATAVAMNQRRPVFGAEAVAERPNGTCIDFAAYSTPIFDVEGACIGAVTMLVDISEQKKSEERLTLLAREMDHRSNNLLTVVQSLIRLTKAESVADYKTILEGRLMALARTNSLISTSRWTDVNLRSLVEDELGAFRSQVIIAGRAIELDPSSAQSLAMIVHELSTNAVKHGALSAADGRVRISWLRRGKALRFVWKESGGPMIEEPIRTNTGNAVIAAAARQLGGQVSRDWRREGLNFRLTCALRDSRPAG